MSHTHRVVVGDERNRAHALLLAHDQADAERYAAGLEAAHPEWHTDITPIDQPDLPDELRTEAAA